MDYVEKAKGIINESLAVYDGFKDKRDDVIKAVAAALTSAYETGAADEKAKVAKPVELPKVQVSKVSTGDVEAEREACAKLAEGYKSQDAIEVFAKMEVAVALSIAQAIRDRSTINA